MRYLSVIRKKSLTERNENGHRSVRLRIANAYMYIVIDPKISLLSDFLTDSLPSI